LYGSKIWTLRKLKRKYLENFKMYTGRDKNILETNEEVLECTGEKRTLLNNILQRKVI
jgi:hypothetical protein